MKIGSTLLGTFLLAVMLAPIPALSSNELLILAPDEFIPQLEVLVRFKNATGRPTTLVSLGQIYGNPNCLGVDAAERVKRCIAFYENSLGIAHVMLVGDVDRFPVRYRWWGLSGQEGWGVSELYYADLYRYGSRVFDDWDFNNNGLYGEIEFVVDPDHCDPNCRSINNDHVDFLPDVSVGRVPASTAQEVSAYVEKVIAYELRTRSSDAWFRKAALYTGTWYPTDNQLKDDVAGYLSHLGFTGFVKRYTDWTDLQHPKLPSGVPGAVVTDLNGGVGMVNYAGHGDPDGWEVLNTSDLAGLRNTDRFPVAFAAACDTGRFSWYPRAHPYVDVNGQQHCGTDNGEDLPPGPYPYTGLPRPAPIQSGSLQCPGGALCTDCNLDHPCFAESLLFGNPVGSTSGAVAYVGSRSGARPLQSIDLDRHFFQAFEGGETVMGNLWKEMILRYHDQHGLSESSEWIRSNAQWEDGHTFDEPQKYILFGDPSLVVGGAFSTARSGTVYDGKGAPLVSYARYRVTGDISVPVGHRLTVQPSSSLLLETGRKVTAWDSNSSNGFVVRGEQSSPVGLLVPYPSSQTGIQGIVVKGQLKLRSGGSVRFF